MNAVEISKIIGVCAATIGAILHKHSDYHPLKHRVRRYRIPPVLKRVLGRDYEIEYRCVFCGQTFSNGSKLGGHRTKTGELLDKGNMVRVLRYRVTHTLNQTLAHFHISEDVLKKIIKDLCRMYNVNVAVAELRESNEVQHT